MSGNEAVRAAAKNRRSLRYGIAFWGFANALTVLVAVLPHAQNANISLVALNSVLILVPLVAVLDLARIGTCHVVATLFLGADGKFIELLRPLLLGSLILVLAAIPYVGVFIAGIGFLAVLCLALQEVDQVEPLQAYILCIVVSAVFLFIQGQISGTL